MNLQADFVKVVSSFVWIIFEYIASALFFSWPGYTGMILIISSTYKENTLVLVTIMTDILGGFFFFIFIWHLVSTVYI